MNIAINIWDNITDHNLENLSVGSSDHTLEYKQRILCVEKNAFPSFLSAYPQAGANWKLLKLLFSLSIVHAIALMYSFMCAKAMNLLRLLSLLYYYKSKKQSLCT